MAISALRKWACVRSPSLPVPTTTSLCQGWSTSGRVFTEAFLPLRSPAFSSCLISPPSASSAALVVSGHSPFSGRAITRQSVLVAVMALLLRLKFMATPVVRLCFMECGRCCSSDANRIGVKARLIKRQAYIVTMALSYRACTVIRLQGYIEYPQISLSTISCFGTARETHLNIVFRYLIRQIMVSMVAVSGILLLVFMSGRFIKYLGNAAEGEIPAGVLFSIMAYRFPGFLELILPLGLFIGILLAYGRMYLESEMTVLFACGVSDRELLQKTLIGAIPVMLVVEI